MEIKTKYDVGQEIWFIEAGETTQKRYINKAIVTGFTIEVNSLYIKQEQTIIHVHFRGVTFEKSTRYEEYIYPTKEACEAAIKEMGQ